MNVAAIDSGRIQAMMAQLKAAATQRPEFNSQMAALGSSQATQSTGHVHNTHQTHAAPKADFASALKASLDQVNTYQTRADEIGKSFAMGDESVHLSDVMVAGQKASLSFQTTVQVRNKLVSAYHDVMNMQI